MTNEDQANAKPETTEAEATTEAKAVTEATTGDDQTAAPDTAEETVEAAKPEPADDAVTEAAAAAETESTNGATAAPEAEAAAAQSDPEVDSSVASSEAVSSEAVAEEAAAPEAPAEAAPAEGATEATPAEATANAAVVEEGPTGPAESAPEQELSLEELAKHSPTLAPAIEAHQSKEPITGKVIGWNKGGFHVALDGIPAFCPKSQMEIGNPKRAHAYVDRDLDFTVAEIKENGKRIVVHRKGLLRKQRQQLIDELKAKATSGEALEGKVTSVTDFGAFVDLGGIEGLVHLSQLSRQRVEKPSDAVQVGQDVKVKVLKVEKGGDRISLSMKALEPDPWKSADEKFEIGDTFTGKVVRATDFGLFVDVGNGMEGLLHSSQLEMKKSMSDYPEGSEVSGWIREVDGGRRRLSLSLREVAKGNPWKDLSERYEEGQQIEGTVEQVAKFGVFVLLEPGLSGLLPFSATQSQGGGGMFRPQTRYNPGDTINVQIDAIDAKRKRISLAPVGSKLEGTKADLRDYQKSAEPTGLNAMAAAFAKLQQGS